MRTASDRDRLDGLDREIPQRDVRARLDLEHGRGLSGVGDDAGARAAAFDHDIGAGHQARGGHVPAGQQADLAAGGRDEVDRRLQVVHVPVAGIAVAHVHRAAALDLAELAEPVPAVLDRGRGLLPARVQCTRPRGA